MQKGKVIKDLVDNLKFILTKKLWYAHHNDFTLNLPS